jgi:hypothetical protein
MTDRPFWSWSGIAARVFAWLARRKFRAKPTPALIAAVFFYGYTDLFGLKESGRFARFVIASYLKKQVARGKRNGKPKQSASAGS